LIFKVESNVDLIALVFNGCNARYFQVKLKAHDFLMDRNDSYLNIYSNQEMLFCSKKVDWMIGRLTCYATFAKQFEMNYRWTTEVDN
jgi:hypothetical protein